MKHISDDRLIILPDTVLSDPAHAHIAILSILSVMVYPEDPEKQHLCRLGYSYDQIIQQRPKEEGLLILNKYSELASLLCYDKDQAIDAVRQTFTSRKRGHTGKLSTRGSIAGHLMCYLAKPDINSLKQTYREYQNNPLQYEGDDISPSTSLLKKIWSDYHHVAHLWAALHIHRNLYGDALLRGPLTPSGIVHPKATKDLFSFLRIAAFFRIKLIDSENLSTLQPHIKNPLLVWDVTIEGKSHIPPLQLSSE